MEKLIDKMRTPITFFCIGVLFSTGLFYFFYRKDLKAEGTSEIEIQSSGENVDADNLERDVYIGGAIKSPGVYTISGDLTFDKIAEKVELLEFSNSDQLKNDFSANSNISSFVYVPYKDGVGCDILGESKVSTSVGGCININSATAGELDSLPGIGEAYAQRIIEGRPYSSKSDIKGIKGIGDKTYQNIESQICL